MDVLYIYNSLTFNKIKCSINKKWRYLNYSYSPEYEKKKLCMVSSEINKITLQSLLFLTF